jgi:hypothetical protein
MSPIEEEVQEGYIHQERDPVVDALFPFGLEDDYSRSQQSIKLMVGSRTYFYSIIMF